MVVVVVAVAVVVVVVVVAAAFLFFFSFLSFTCVDQMTFVICADVGVFILLTNIHTEITTFVYLTISTKMSRCCF